MRAVLIDTGRLVALIDKSDEWHELCRDTLASLDEPLVTVWPVLTEASYFLDDSEAAQATLLEWVEDGSIRFAHLDRDDVPRIRELMRKYRDLPMDLADASLVRIAERDRIDRIFTIDRRDFEIYRPSRTSRFRILP
jgi:uncharacterized protein